jgi:uncharacterized protein
LFSSHRAIRSPIISVLYNFLVPLRAKLRLATILVIFAAVAAWAEPISQLKPTDYVNDFAHVLDQNTITQIDGICLQIEQKAHAQITLVTINTLDGSDIESYAVELFKQWGVGSKQTNRGVLILYAIQDHRARIEVGYGLEPILPDGKVGSFQREAIPLVRSGEYSQALLLVTSRVADVIASDAGVQLTGSRPAPMQPVRQPSSGMSFGGVIVLIVIVLIVLFTPLRSVLFWILFSSMFDGRGGGGFGGFGGSGGFSGGGGGGFGGFGGGSSGGGGATSSW